MSTKIRYTSGDQGFSTGNCGLQICPHPACWEAAKRLNREMHFKSKKLPRKRSTHKVLLNKPNKEKEFAIETPTLSILNVLEENEEYRPPSPSTISLKQSNVFPSLPHLPSSDSDVLTKLQLKSITHDSGSGFTPAPANTPLHSCHRIEGIHNQDSEGLTDNLSQSQKHSSTSKGNQSPQPSCHNMVLDFHHGEKKKLLQWKSNHKIEIGQGDANSAAFNSKNKVASDLILPIESLPVHSQETSWKNTKTKKSLKPINFTNISVPIELSSSQMSNSKKENSARKNQTKQTSTQIPREIERLRLVPSDVLLRVVKMALHNKVLTLEQADVLMFQVTGQKYSFYKENSSGKRTISKTNLCFTTQKKVHSPRDPKKASNTIIGSAPSVYKLDPVHAEVERKVQTKQESRSHSRQKQKTFEEMLLHSHTSEILPRSESPTKIHLSAIKSTVGCVVKTADETNLTSPTKPFHYQKNTYGMCLHPLPTPPPASPSTERDSKYNEILGGSTVLANPSRTGSVATFDRPVSGSSFTSRKRDSTTFAANDYKTNSSTKSTLWPQVDEAIYLESDPETLNPAYSCSPEIEKISPPVAEEKLPPLTERSSDTQQTIESSPVPPPPSPVVPHHKEEDTTELKVDA